MADAPADVASYEAFLRSAIRRQWAEGKGDRTTFLSLLLATREAWPVALERWTREDAAPKTLAASAGVVAVGFALRALLGGPLSLALTAGTIAALSRFYVSRSTEIRKRADHARKVIERFEPEFWRFHQQSNGERATESQRELMLDGLVARFLRELEDVEPGSSMGDPEAGSFRAHVERKREEEG